MRPNELHPSIRASAPLRRRFSPTQDAIGHDIDRLRVVILVWTIILSFLVARLVVTPIIHFLYYQLLIASLSQLRLLVSEKNDWPFPNGHAAFLLAIATAMYLYNKKWGIGFFIAVLFLNTCRIIAGVYSLSDMLGGMIIGIRSASLFFYFAEKRRIQEIR